MAKTDKRIASAVSFLTGLKTRLADGQPIAAIVTWCGDADERNERKPTDASQDLYDRLRAICDQIEAIDMAIDDAITELETF